MVLESELLDTLNYVTRLLLCGGWEWKLKRDYNRFRNSSTDVWSLLRKVGVTPGDRDATGGILRSNLTNTSTLSTSARNVNYIVNALYSARTNPTIREPRGMLLLGTGLGMLGGVIASKIFGASNADEINKINENLHKHTASIKLTNERIDILAKNISRSNEIVKNVLDKMLEKNIRNDLHYAFLWNFEETIALNRDIQKTFELAELTLALLDHGILNPELINLDSFKAIVAEGLKLFPGLVFPFGLNRYWVHPIAQAVHVQRMARLKYIMIIPLATNVKYDLYTLIPHPIKIGNDRLAFPKSKNAMLIQENKTYITTTTKNIHSATEYHHILLEEEPIFRQTKLSCEWSIFNQKINDILTQCDFERAGNVGDTYTIETNRDRLVYFTKATKVTLDCPGKNIQTTLVGLHNMSLGCSITTKNEHFPAKLTATMVLVSNETHSFDPIELPIPKVNESNAMHDSLREILKKLPGKNDSYTIDFDYYQLSNNQLHTYTLLSGTFISLIVILNSVGLIFLLCKWKIRDTDTTVFNHIPSSLGHRIRDSLRNKKNLMHRDSFRRWGSKMRSRGSTIKGKVLSKMSGSAPVTADHRTHSSLEPRAPEYTDSTEEAPTENHIHEGNHIKSYPALPRYIDY